MHRQKISATTPQRVKKYHRRTYISRYICMHIRIYMHVQICAHLGLQQMCCRCVRWRRRNICVTHTVAHALVPIYFVRSNEKKHHQSDSANLPTPVESVSLNFFQSFNLFFWVVNTKLKLYSLLEFLFNQWVIEFYPRQCKTSLVGQSAWLSIPMSLVWFQ